MDPPRTLCLPGRSARCRGSAALDADGHFSVESYLCSIGPMKVTHSLVLVCLAILDMSAEADGRIWGYPLSKRSGVRSGVLYPTLDRMLNEGWLEDHWEEGAQGQKRPARRYYVLTDKGRANLGAVVRRAESEQRFVGIRTAQA